MFNLRNFIKNGFLKAVGQMADYQIILNAAGWYEKGVLIDDDLAIIQEKIDAQYNSVNDNINENTEENDTQV